MLKCSGEHIQGAALGTWAQNFQYHLAQGIYLQFDSGQQPLQAALLLAQLLELLGGVAILRPQARRQLYSIAGDSLSSAAISSPVLPSAVNSSARRSLRTISSLECRFRTAMF